MVEHRGVVVHIAQGSYEGTISWQRNPDANVSSHFVVGLDGKTAQVVDTDVAAWTQRAGNGHWLSIENAGFVPNPLTAAQVEANARILARAHQVYGIPLQVTSDPDNGRGLGHHSMGARPGSPLDWGHSACPGSAIIAQKAAIVARAQQLVSGTGGTLMALTEAEQAELLGKVRQLWSLVHDGKRGAGLAETAGGGQFIAYLVRRLEGMAGLPTTAQLLADGLARVEAKLEEPAPPLQVVLSAEQLGDVVRLLAAVLPDLRFTPAGPGA